MPALNPYVFPLVPLTEPAPETAARSGMGGWDAYGLTAPSDALLPFVLARRMAASNAPWLACAWIVNALTGQRVVTLQPTGAQATTPALGLPFTKLPDAANGNEYFTYDGALVPGLGLPCGVPLRLLVDNAYQSPLFYAAGPLGSLPAAYLPLEWYELGPAQGVPYGRGFHQRFYVANAAVQQLDAREEKVSSKDPDSGVEVVESLNLFNQVQFTVDPVPAYLAQALTAAKAPRYFLADGQPWRLLSVKSTPAGTDGGRWSLSATLEDQTPLARRGCTAAPLPTETYDSAAPPARGWRCADSSDKAADYQPTGTLSCETNASGQRTGYALAETRDANPYSPSYQQLGPAVRSQDEARCPLPIAYLSAPYAAQAQRNNCDPGQVGSTVTVASEAGRFTSTISQVAANQKAIDYVQTNVQTIANQTGTCFAGRRIRIDSPSAEERGVSFSIVRTDTAGPVTVQVRIVAYVRDGSAPYQANYTQSFTLPDGADGASDLYLSYGGATLSQFTSITIYRTLPGDYQITT